MNRLFLLLFGMVTFVAHAQVPDYVPTEGLVAWYPFNGNANDESGNGHHGSESNVSYAAGPSGNESSAAHFNGDAQILIPHDPMWNATEYTLSIGYKWEINASATPNGNSLIMSKRPGSGWGSGFEHSPGGGLSWSIDGNGGAGIGISLPQQEWIQVT